jgi:hypothetical protein
VAYFALFGSAIVYTFEKIYAYIADRLS